MTKHRSLTLSLTVAIFIAINVQSHTAAVPVLAIGKPAPEFKLADLGGKTHALKDYRGKTVVVSFISARCPISKAYIDRIRAVADEYSKREVAFLGVNSNADESIQEMRAYAAKNNLDFTILKDKGNVIADAYAAERTPKVYVIDGEGLLRYQGRIDNSQNPKMVKRNDLREALNEMLAGKPISVADTKALGCLIKRIQDAKAAPAKIPAKAEPAQKEPKVGTLKPVDFDKFKDSAKGKVLVLNFWATWCGPCVAEFPELVALDAQYRDKGVKLVGITADDPGDVQPKVIPFIKKQKVKFDIILQDTDDPQEMFDKINKDWPGVLPATFVYDKRGNLAYSRFGIIDRDLLVAEIEKALK
ncbi:MAG TPA: redoxin domain-containing protein [Blastocatellia bacterium]|nr:redoxin domain-containing protein [Blastocatellia bacterium]